MFINHLKLFQSLHSKMDWIDQNQKILSKNIANSDTPHFRATKIEPFSHKNQNFSMALKTTHKNHIQYGQKYSHKTKHVWKESYETSPAKNNVILEENMKEMHKNHAAHHAVNQIYRNHLNLFKIVLK